MSVNLHVTILIKEEHPSNLRSEAVGFQRISRILPEISAIKHSWHLSLLPLKLRLVYLQQVGLLKLIKGMTGGGVRRRRAHPLGAIEGRKR